MTNDEATSVLEDMIREQYPQAVVTFQPADNKFIALTGTEPGDRTEFVAPGTHITPPHIYAISRGIIEEWDSRKASNPYA